MQAYIAICTSVSPWWHAYYCMSEYEDAALAYAEGMRLQGYEQTIVQPCFSPLPYGPLMENGQYYTSPDNGGFPVLHDETDYDDNVDDAEENPRWEPIAHPRF